VDLDIGFKRSSGPEQNKEYFNTGEIPVRVYLHTYGYNANPIKPKLRPEASSWTENTI
jgi:hypothetical protein